MLLITGFSVINSTFWISFWTYGTTFSISLNWVSITAFSRTSTNFSTLISSYLTWTTFSTYLIASTILSSIWLTCTTFSITLSTGTGTSTGTTTGFSTSKNLVTSWTIGTILSTRISLGT